MNLVEVTAITKMALPITEYLAAILKQRWTPMEHFQPMILGKVHLVAP